MTVSGPNLSGFSLLFPVDGRPDCAAIARLLHSNPQAARSFSISHLPDSSEGWLELLANGLTFDLAGLAPAPARPAPPLAHSYGFAGPSSVPAGEWISIAAGQHLVGGQNLVPVVRGMAAVVLALLELSGAAAVAWGPARSVLSPDYFRRAVGAWLGGGAFPALGLTALLRDPSGAMISEGLGFFTAQELRIDPILARNPASAGKIAIRLIHSLVSGWSVSSPTEIVGPSGERLGVEPTANGRILRVWQTL
jgi:hypothetical protein